MSLTLTLSVNLTAPLPDQAATPMHRQRTYVAKDCMLCRGLPGVVSKGASSGCPRPACATMCRCAPRFPTGMCSLSVRRLSLPVPTQIKTQHPGCSTARLDVVDVLVAVGALPELLHELVDVRHLCRVVRQQRLLQRLAHEGHEQARSQETFINDAAFCTATTPQTCGYPY